MNDIPNGAGTLPDSIRVITFDVGGTLLDPYPGVGSVYSEIAAELGLTAPPDSLEKRFRKAFGDRQARPRPRLDNHAEEVFWREVTDEVFAPYAGVEEMDRVFPRLWDAFARPERWRPKPDADAVLVELSRRGYRLAVLSNWDSRLRAVVEGHGWGGRFERLFISAEMGVEKPAPEIFSAVEETLGASAGEILHVGDSVRQDALGAAGAGWNAVLITDAPVVPHGFLIRGCLGDLLNLLPSP